MSVIRIRGMASTFVTNIVEAKGMSFPLEFLLMAILFPNFQGDIEGPGIKGNRIFINAVFSIDLSGLVIPL
jgi:uncharacterized membrane protein (DUF441 family)